MSKNIKDQFSNCLEILEQLSEKRELLREFDEEQRVRFFKLCGQISRPTKEDKDKTTKNLRKQKKERIKEINKKARGLTGIRSARETNVFTAPKELSFEQINSEESKEYATAKECYICRAKFTKIHHFYDLMCSSCGDLNYQKRYQSTDLKGQVALITGSRLKIGYHCVLMMLKSGATVIATTRFPVDSALRYSKEPDYHEWKDRLKIYGLDLRHTPSVELFARHIENTYDRLDILINNAAQTVRRPSGFYEHLMENERKLAGQLPIELKPLLADHLACINQLESFHEENTKNLPLSWHAKAPGVGIRASAALSQIPYSFDDSLEASQVFPKGELDVDLQQVDLRTVNSWRLNLGEVPVPEMLEVQLVNAIAPFVLCNRLVGMMRRDYTGKKHIVNVTAMEGKFHRFKKESRHPHTNMAKAALNMMTHTCALDFAKDGIYTNAVDTGWVTDEDPAHLAKRKQDLHDFQPPLDIVDGAARVCDPFIDGINTGKHWCGKFLKDYFPIDW